MYGLNFETFHIEMKKALGWQNERDLNDSQLKAIRHLHGPLLITAGPGSGKTEVLVWKCIKLLVVDDIDPKSIFITTFTEKAAKNLIDRISYYLTSLTTYLKVPFSEMPDISLIKIGTLHSLCNKIMQEYRYVKFQNKRLMDEFEQKFFVHRYTQIATKTSPYNNPLNKDFWNFFGVTLCYRKWDRTDAGISILNRIVEDNLDIEKMREKAETDQHFKTLLKFYDDYNEKMEEHYRCDFSTLQMYFAEFLQSRQGELFINGDESQDIPPIRFVLVDEYQDTNPIQEEIYFKLASKTKNLTVVGDDDQAMYRFRGASVDAIVKFAEQCKTNFGINPEIVQLDINYRSHPKIVEFFNEYLFNYDEYNKPGVRIVNKQPMKAFMSPSNDWNPILFLYEENEEKLAYSVGELIDYIRTENLITDLSQIVLLFTSTREGPKGTKYYIEELKKRKIPYFNPRSRMIHNSEEFLQLIGALIELIDPTIIIENDLYQGKYQNENPLSWLVPNSDANAFISNCRKAYKLLDAPKLKEFIETAQKEILETKNGETIGGTNMFKVYYRIINMEPFCSYINDPVVGPRIGLVSSLLESYINTSHFPFIRSDQNEYGLKRNIIGDFYVSFCELLVSDGLNDYEDKDYPIPEGFVQIMTYHQAKGLEFPFVFLLHLNRHSKVGLEHHLENLFEPFKKKPSNIVPDEERALHDFIRKIYVGKSRAQYGLILGLPKKGTIEALGSKKVNNKIVDLTNIKSIQHFYQVYQTESSQEEI